MPRTRPNRWRTALGLALALDSFATASGGCTAAPESMPAPLPGATTTAPDGISGGAGGAGGSPVRTTSSSISTRSTSSASSGSGGAGASGAACDQTWACVEDLGYWATATAFTAPTPKRLAAALNELAYEDGARPISFVLRAQGGSLLAALSATVAGTAGKDVFPADEAPLFAEVIVADGQGVTTAEAQPSAFLRFVDQQGPVRIAIEHLVWNATEHASCNTAWVHVQAVVPLSQYGTVIHGASGDHTLEELIGAPVIAPAPDPSIESPDGGPPPGGALPAQLRFSFHGASMAFDFSSL